MTILCPKHPHSSQMQSWSCPLAMPHLIIETNQTGGHFQHLLNSARLICCSLPKVASTVNPFYLAPVLQLPQIILSAKQEIKSKYFHINCSIVGQKQYLSRVSGNEEYLPIAGFVGTNGSDLMLANLAKAVLDQIRGQSKWKPADTCSRWQTMSETWGYVLRKDGTTKASKWGSLSTENKGNLNAMRASLGWVILIAKWIIALIYACALRSIKK